jgi:hypothetical protein
VTDIGSVVDGAHDPRLGVGCHRADLAIDGSHSRRGALSFCRHAEFIHTSIPVQPRLRVLVVRSPKFKVQGSMSKVRGWLLDVGCWICVLAVLPSLPLWFPRPRPRYSTSDLGKLRCANCRRRAEATGDRFVGARVFPSPKIELNIELVPKAASQSLCRNPLSEHFVALGHFQRNFDKDRRQSWE